jgi:hypothetical protein
MVGFGVWHVVDSVLSHWVLGIHRVRLDSPNPLMWDLIWFAVFGILPLLAGWLLLGRTRRPRRMNSSILPMLALGLFTASAAIWSAQPPGDQRFTTVVFSPLISPAQAIDAVRAEGGKLVWSDPAMGVLVVAVPEERRFNFYRHGAVLVSGAATGGCFNWSV